MVYIDTYFLWNLCMNLLLLELTGRLRRYRSSWGRKVTGAALGAVFSVLQLAVPLPGIWGDILLPVAAAVLMCRICFHSENRRQLAIQSVWLWAVTLLMGGILNWLYFHTGLGYVVQVCLRTGDRPIAGIWLLPAAVVAGGGILAAQHWYEIREKQKKAFVQVILRHRGRQVELCALADTGNRLHTPGGSPVSLISLETAAGLLAAEELEHVKQFYGAAIPEGGKERKELQHARGLLVIPYRSVGKDYGVLPAVRIGELEVCQNTEHHVTKEAVIAVSQEKLTENGRYEMILHTGLL